jgi:hypothetical protein
VPAPFVCWMRGHKKRPVLQSGCERAMCVRAMTLA